MPENPRAHLEATVGPEEACEILEVAVERLPDMVDQGLLTQVETPEGPRFSRAELLAVRQLGA